METKKEKHITIDMIEEMADKFFPIRDKDNKPSYREHQRETIIKISKSFFVDEKKFVAVDGPVGCGKSVINYTVARIAEDTVYLTPLKMLQDQIAAEEWEGVKMLKGRGSYACNLCGYDDTDYRCTYSGPDFKTCQNSRETNEFRDNTLDVLGEKIKEVHEKFGHNKFVLRLRSAFSSFKEYKDSLSKIATFLMEQKKVFLRKTGVSEENARYNNDVEKNIACRMGEVHECPANSSKVLAKMAPVRVLNPDIFFLLNKSPFSFYLKNSLMVYDECHQIEGVMNRIFKVKLPLETVNNLFGVDMRRFYDMDNQPVLLEEISNYVNKTLSPLLAAARTVGSLGDVFSVRNWVTLQRIKSVTQTADILRSVEIDSFFYRRMSDKKSISMLEVINYAFTGEKLPGHLLVFKSFVEGVKSIFDVFCEKYCCESKINIFDTLVPAAKKFINGNDLNRLKRKRTRDLKGSEVADYTIADILVSEDQVYADHIYLFGKTIDKFTTSAVSLINIKDEKFPSFVIDGIMDTLKSACNGTPLYDEASRSSHSNRKEKCLEITPIAIGRLMKLFFYSRADKVLLTSGTWVCPESLFKVYGIPNDDVEFIKIPSTFKPSNRKIFVVDNKGFTDFSEKDTNYNGSYVYRSDDGVKKFTLELSSIVKRIRRYIKDNHDKNANIIVHCHTFNIAHNIAEYAPGVDDTYFIHLQNPGSQIQNRKTKHIVWARDKDELIENIKDHPNSGLTIISPSISEGVDFKGDMARAQIILKRPIPYLGDIYVKSYYKGNPDVGIERDPDFLDRICFTAMTQQYGRVVRSVDDWGYTVIMDQSITWALKGLAKHRRRISDLNINYFWEGMQIDSSRPGIPAFPWIFG